MAPTFRSGKGAVLLFNNANLSGILQNVTVQQSAAALDVTVYGDNDKAYISGLRDGNVKYEGLFDGTALSTASTASTGALDYRFATALQASTQPVVTYGPEGGTIGRRARLYRQESVSYMAQSPVADVVRVSAEGQISNGKTQAGVWLLPPAAYTSTSSTYASVNSGVTGGTTSGGTGHFHMTADSTVATFQVKIQHSSAAVSWADLITFSSSTGTTASGSVQHSTVSGTVKQYVRAAITTFTGGTGKSATVGVAFARAGNIKL